MALRRTALSRPTTVVPEAATGIVIGSIILSSVVLPVFILWLGTYGGQSVLNISMLTFGLISMLPAVLLGITSLLVMLGSKS